MIFGKKCSENVFKKALFIFLIISAFLFRIYQLEKRTGFGADQEELFYKAQELLSGDPVLLGMVTSVGGFAIGPFFTYLWTFFSLLFSGNPIGGSYLSIFLGILTIIVLYISARQIFKSDLTAFILAFICSFSYSIYVWDISPWPPSLFYLSQVLIIAGAYLFLKKTYGLLMMSLGFAVGFSSHISIFISIIPVIVFVFINRTKVKKQLDRRYVYYSLLIIFLGILPNIVFDLTHQFVNIKRLLGLVTNPGSDSFYPVTLPKVFESYYESGVKILIPAAEKKTDLYLFIAMIVVFLISLKDKKRRDFLMLILIYLIFVPLVFLFWKGNFSEYYLTMITVPAFIFLIASLIDFYLVKKKFLLLIFLMVFLYLNISEWKIRSRPLNLAAMKNTVNLIIEKGSSGGYGVSLTTKPGYQFGYKYLFDYYRAYPDIPPKKGETEIFTIIVPAGFDGIRSMVEYDGIGVLWQGTE